ncbi:MAG: response regulator FixJ [Caulobacteraceae bacterium]
MSERLVHVVDDDDAVRDALRVLLEISGYQVKTYDSGVRFLEALTGEETGCVITDVRMPGITGLAMSVSLRQRGSKLPVIVITGQADVPMAVEAIKAGVRDFIEKPFDDVAILNAVEAALAGTGEADQDDNGQRSLIRQRIDTLSMRERQVLGALVAGKPNKVTARDLGISPRTVAIYRANVMSKMQAGSLAELVRMAIAAGEAA